MTTLVALATKDALVMGCDSLGTVTKSLLDPLDLLDRFFNPEDGNLKIDGQGAPILKNFYDIYGKAQEIPFNQMTHVGKLHPLTPLPMGVMSTGIASIGNRTIKSLINEFKEKRGTVRRPKRRKVPNTTEGIANELLAFIADYYVKEYEKWQVKPYLELMIGGYSQREPFPEIFRIFLNQPNVVRAFTADNPFGIVFGGQMQEIQRIVFGTDYLNSLRLEARVEELIEKYRKLLKDLLNTKGIGEELPGYAEYKDELSLFKDWSLNGFDANWGDFSEQNAVECVDFFVEVMARSQQLSSHLPTVGGEIHIGLITKEKGFKFISKELLVHKGHETMLAGD
jgi:hypothetical protein